MISFFLVFKKVRNEKEVSIITDQKIKSLSLAQTEPTKVENTTFYGV